MLQSGLLIIALQGDDPVSYTHLDVYKRQGLSMQAVLLPLLVASVGILASVIGFFFVRAKEGVRLGAVLERGIIISAVIVLVASYFLTINLLGDLKAFWAIVSGLLAGIFIGRLTEYYTSDHFKPVKNIAKASETGTATNIIGGLAIGMRSTALPVLTIVAAILVSYHLAGIYGIALAAVGMLSTVCLLYTSRCV